VPEAFRLDGSALGYDMGTRMLRTFARCVEPDDAKRAILLDGEPGTVPEPPPAAPSPLEAAEARDRQMKAERDRQFDKYRQEKSGKKAKPEPEKQPEPPPPPPPPRWSEPFVDLNGNKQCDDGERYLDTDRDNAFTAKLVVNDPNGNGKRDIGLLEWYRLHAWGRQVISVVAVDEVLNGPSAATTSVAPAATRPPAK
jgi:hypothetical protein